MSERIDHAAEAVACEEAGLSLMRTHGMAPHMEAVMQFDLARLHAQLALVEQQRIANRIALAVAIREDTILGGTATDLSDWLHEGNGVIGYFSAAEQEDLGIG